MRCRPRPRPPKGTARDHRRDRAAEAGRRAARAGAAGPRRSSHFKQRRLTPLQCKHIALLLAHSQRTSCASKDRADHNRDATGSRAFVGIYLDVRAKGDPNLPAPIPELSVVTLTHPFEYKARKLPEGTVGTVVHAWSDGEHYAVEFSEPFPCVVSLARGDIQPA